MKWSLEAKEKIIKKLLDAYAENNAVHIGVEELADLCGLEIRLSKQEKKLRGLIQVARSQLYQMGYVVHNKRNVGYKIAHKFEAMDEKEKQCHRAYRIIVNLEKTHFNKNLIFYDLGEDPDRQKQHQCIQEFKAALNEGKSKMRLALIGSPFRQLAEDEIANSDFVTDLKGDGKTNLPPLAT